MENLYKLKSKLSVKKDHKTLEQNMKTVIVNVEKRIIIMIIRQKLGTPFNLHTMPQEESIPINLPIGFALLTNRYVKALLAISPSDSAKP